MQSGNREWVRSEALGSSALFLPTLAQNAGLPGRIPLPESVAAGRHARCMVQALSIVSLDNLAWEVWLFGNKLFQTTGHPELERFLGFWSFAAADARQIGATGFYHYYIDGLGVQYLDEDGHNEPQAGCFLNVVLVNRSAGAKTANGWFQMAFAVEPTLG